MIKPPRGTTITLSIVAIVAIIAIMLIRVPSAGAPYSPDSTAPNGTRALASILRANGIEVSHIGAPHVLDYAVKDTTLVLDPSFTAPTHVVDDLVASRATIIFLDTPAFDAGFEGEIQSAPPTPVSAQCSDPDATEARGISPLGHYFVPTDTASVTGCFPHIGGYGWVALAKNPRVSYLPDSRFITNEFLADHGNAAFALRKLGAHPTVVWVSGAFSPDKVQPTSWAGLPTWFFPLLAGLGLCLGWWALYRGRRFGKLVAEPMPVLVPASEADAGRGYLYHRGKNYEHAASALRAATISRLAPPRGIATSSTPEAVVAALQTNTYSHNDVWDLLYGRAITSRRDLVELADQLDQFERDINDQ
ncbi:DUF4350 domain-containing protein [Trueperella pecoris]|uniref:DUF4350 domain-containing protein n=1 Tax=Trueperella pecoris TaxID=2733571 RepID=UPI001ABDD8D7|nr:DUF4350 domain-containing protein [Trueperella pecoris]QTG75086.1 DUF4350 domain-containing protein [Trueperella pecoris]